MLGVTLGTLIEQSWGILFIGVFGGLAQYYRSKVDDKWPSFEELISFHPLWKWFTVIYFLLVSAFSLHYIYELSQLNRFYGFVYFALAIFLPIIVPVARHDYLLYVRSK